MTNLAIMSAGLSHSSGISLEAIKPDSIVAILKVKDEAHRLPFLLAYHRWLGVDHFVVLNNRSSDNTAEMLRKEHDVSVIDAPGEFRGPNGYRAWIRSIIETSPPERWHLILDADELLVAPPWRQGGLRLTIKALEAEGADVASAVMVDCYPESFMHSAADAAAIVPWLRSPWFDSGPYGRWRTRKRKVSPTYSGVRERLFWPHWRYLRFLPRLLQKKLNIKRPPYIVKWPLLKRSAGLRGMHVTSSTRRPSSYFCLLHYKLDIGLERKIQSAIAEGQYFQNSIEYRIYAAALGNESLRVKTNRSRQFSGIESLRQAQLCHFSPFLLGHLRDYGPLDTDISQALGEIAGFAEASLARRLEELRTASEAAAALAGHK